jgi:hypothetical protein
MAILKVYINNPKVGKNELMIYIISKSVTTNDITAYIFTEP